MKVLRTGVHPAVQPRLIRGGPPEWESRAGYERSGGYRPGLHGQALIDAVAASGLRGRGGAAFPLVRKLTAVAGQPGEHVVLVNGEEGEPASVKDRWLLRTRPHLVLDGALRAARAVGARDVRVYVSDRAAALSVHAALAELSHDPDNSNKRGSAVEGSAVEGSAVEGSAVEGSAVDAGSIRVFEVEPSYVAGEETAAVNALNGRPPKPSDKPPRPFEEGVRGLPTLVSNAETLANLPSVAAGQPADTFLLTLGGAVPRPGLYEVPFGITIAEATAELGGLAGRPRGYVMGGYFAGLLNSRGADLPLDYDRLKAAGTGLGCGAITVLGSGDCPVGTAALLLSYFGRENAGQCGSCFNGTAAMAGVAAALARGEAGPAELERLEHWAGFLPGRGACATLDGAAGIAATLLHEFPDEAEAHSIRSDKSCAATDFGSAAAPFAADPGPLCPQPAAPRPPAPAR